MNKPTLIGFVPVVITIALFGAYVAYASSQPMATMTTYTGTTTRISSFLVGSVIFSGAWSYSGNLTLTGAQSTCEVLGVPCAENPSNIAMEFKEASSTAEVEFASLNNVPITVVLINGEPFCVSPKLFNQPICPSEIGTANFPFAVEDTNSTLNLELVLSLNTTTVQSGNGIAINVTEFNTLDFPNSVPKGNDWAINGLTLGSCGTLNYPMRLEIFQGNYGMNNISSLSGKSGPLFYHPGMYSCPAFFFIKNYNLEPSSNIATLAVVSSPSSNVGPLPMSTTVDISGSWTVGNTIGIGAVFHNFAQGIYTVVAGDEWGDIALLQFTVS